MASSLTQLIRRWSDGEYNEFQSDGNRSSSLDTLVHLMERLFGSCSGNLQSIFGNTSSSRSRCAHPTKRTDSNDSQSTATTEESSIKSKPKESQKKLLKSKSAIDYSSKKKSRDETIIRRHRSTSKYDMSTSLALQRQNTEIVVVQTDDDISAISAHTLNEMHRKELRQKQRKAIMSQKPFSPVNYPGKENMSTNSYISELSECTTEFESIWKARSFGSPANSNADNYHSVNRGDLRCNSSINRDNQLQRQRETRRPFATIEENDSLYIDEQEI